MIYKKRNENIKHINSTETMKVLEFGIEKIESRIKQEMDSLFE
jgi:hypothetical protein